ncbi:IS110 family transposase [Bradyrhizobium ontarionense]|uniref:IS110 family transposase n=1 Tax=Bradyrhizobium ontarionense TaxID=2898149 RepID=A0ABY3RGL4_9BRAD|nr:IS110 family transposase [Bradyrhizobium sp. A19]UFZ02132.1 IS110 family transposase [Bradyrhizobium sp. A19]UFZ04189.1 IS110 family transposase [Bradyrhizobium sp. A19]UFZ05393.1 IS110 family transposase [Bradyrhizobium sp. A19]UFZ06424.1 IS110 family transposase [Bradyrhizobium sp. A19]UFZ06583.1 IS110 family transposase [Bradyrhizobium sp. A19]
MQASTQGTLTAGDTGTIFVAIELSQKSWLITLHSPDQGRMSRHKLDGVDQVGLLALIAKTRARAAQKLGSEPRVASCYEAGYDGFWLHRLLVANGIDNLVFDPASIAVEQRARRAKTDRIDGELLLRTLMAYLRGEPRVVRIVRVPTVEQEDARRVSRERDRLVTEQTAHTNRIKALLRLSGLEVGAPRRRNWLTWLEQQRDWQGEPLPPHVLAEVKREHARLMLVREQLAALEQSQEAAQAAVVPEAMAKRREQLQRLKGLGPAFATTLAGELFYKDFRNRREVASYCGLTPSPWKSGGIDREQGISKAGNPHVRLKTIELAWLWVRHQPDSALSRWFQTRTLNTGKRVRRIAIVALARKLVVALWRYLETGLVPEEALMKA